MNTSAPPVTDRHFGFLEWGEKARIPAHIWRRPEHRQSRVWGAIRCPRLDSLTFPFTRETLATVNPSPRENRTHVQEDMPETWKQYTGWVPCHVGCILSYGPFPKCILRASTPSEMEPNAPFIFGTAIVAGLPQMSDKHLFNIT